MAPTGNVTMWEDFHADRAAAAQAAIRPPKRQPLNWVELSQHEPPARKWIYPGWLGYDPTILVGMGGVGKTLLAQHLGTALATGTEFIGETAKPLTVLMWACEDDKDELWRRQVDICRAMNVSMESLLGSLVIEPRRGLDSTLFATQYNLPIWTGLMGELTEQVNDYKADVLILDNVGQTFGANENDRHHVTQFINGIVGLREGDFCPLMLAHPSRASASEYAGSAAWENAVRMRWLFGETLPDAKVDPDEEPETNTRYLSRRKSNYSSKDWRRFTLVNGALSIEARIDGEEALHRSRARRVVMEGFRRITGMGQDCSASPHASNHLGKLIVSHRLNEGLTLKQLSAALSDVMLDGELRIGVVGHYSNRTPKQGLIEGDPK